MFDFLLFISVLAVLIIGHELGHFIAARLTGVRVEEFGLGFPPRLATLFEARGTKFTLNLIPLGGFVRPAGEDDPNIPNGLAGASKRVRGMVALAGPAFNIFLGFLAFFLAFKFAAPDLEKVLITDLVEDAPAQLASIQIGDLIRTVDEVPITGFAPMLELFKARSGSQVEIGLERDGQLITVHLVPRVEYPSDQGPIGATIGHPAKETTWIEAAKLGLDNLRFQFIAILSFPGRLIRGTIEPEEARVGGLKAIHDMLAWASDIDRSAQRPFFTLNLIGVISVGLAIANLLPFPALDGGRILFVLFEAVFKRRLAPHQEGLVNTIGFAILLVLMVYINLQDFVNPISLPR